MTFEVFERGDGRRGERGGSKRRVDAFSDFGHFPCMSTLTEIEEAIEELPLSDVETLAVWLERRRQAARETAKLDKREAVAAFLRRWSGAASASPTDEALDADRMARLMEKHVK